MPRFDAILFDFDGVLVDSEPMHCACWAEVLAPLGVILSWEQYRERFAGRDDREMLRSLAAEADPPLDWKLLWAQFPAKQRCFCRKMKDPPFLPQLADLLERLSKEFNLAVVTSSSRIEIEPPLEARHLRQYFSALVTGEDVERHKPAPDPYLLAARLLGARTPLVVEDSAPGLASGCAAGFAVLEVSKANDMPDLLRTCLFG